MLRLNRKTNVNGEPCAPRGARTVREGVGIPGLPHVLNKLLKKNQGTDIEKLLKTYHVIA